MDGASFEHIRTKWAPEIALLCPNTPILLVGTKLDLVDNEEALESLAERRMVPVQSHQGQELARDINASLFLECSALSGAGLTELLYQAALASSRPVQSGIRECLLS